MGRLVGDLRDRDVFDEGITIEDNLALVVDYRNGATLSYSLNAHAPWEGYRVAVNGTLGRVELDVIERGAVVEEEDLLHPGTRGDGHGFTLDQTAVPGAVPASSAARQRRYSRRLAAS